MLKILKRQDLLDEIFSLFLQSLIRLVVVTQKRFAAKLVKRSNSNCKRIYYTEKLKLSCIILKLTITLCFEDGNLFFKPLIFLLILGEEKNDVYTFFKTLKLDRVRRSMTNALST